MRPPDREAPQPTLGPDNVNALSRHGRAARVRLYHEANVRQLSVRPPALDLVHLRDRVSEIGLAEVHQRLLRVPDVDRSELPALTETEIDLLDEPRHTPIEIGSFLEGRLHIVVGESRLEANNRDDHFHHLRCGCPTIVPVAAFCGCKGCPHAKRGAAVIGERPKARSCRARPTSLRSAASPSPDSRAPCRGRRRPRPSHAPRHGASALMPPPP